MEWSPTKILKEKEQALTGFRRMPAKVSLKVTLGAEEMLFNPISKSIEAELRNAKAAMLGPENIPARTQILMRSPRSAME